MTSAMGIATAQEDTVGCTERQLAAITSRAKSTIVLAGPGSGKTTVSKHRVVYLQKHLGVSRVGIVTFTRASAVDIKARLDVAGVSRDKFLAETFHAHALRQLRASGRTIDAHRDVVQAPEQREHLRLAIADSAWDGPFNAARAVLERAAAYFHPDLSEAEVRLVATYRESLKIQGKYDFADLLRLTVLGMRDGSVPRLPVEHLIIDEAQDIDDVQIEWILCHAENGIGTTLVGDDDQSIYGFRHAQGLQGLRRYSNRVGLPLDAWLYLAENFRSRAEIVRHSQELIGHARDRFPKTIHAPRGGGGQVDCLSFKNEEEELTRMALTLKPDPNAWAVLARTNKQLDRVELALDQRGIHYWRQPGEGIWETGIGLAVMSLLSSLVAKDKVNSKLVQTLILLDAFRAPQQDRKRIVDTDDVKVLFGFIQAQGVSLASDDAKKRAIQALERNWLDWRAKIIEGEDAEESDRLARTKDIIGEAHAWMGTMVPKNKKALLRAIFNCLLKRRGYLKNRIKASSFKKADSADGVVISTMHGAKGLEFESVWVFGLDAADEEELSSDEIEEERRLVYVAFTRAKSRLTTSYVTERCGSRFLAEALLSAENTKRKRARAPIYGAAKGALRNC